ncbi:AraC family transcriptional regulator [Microbacterium sp. SSM24]|uniref:AraC family transcriptional regulator n=1 Tax=Microbacterium sp. SSM24 TaxID=2991714 RepID=UPI0022274DE0|nr:helix-turn-helix domain-containing protein [Microbacterium sp. SSM24]MCW3493324.1 helix-turn-helix domain-containing protein [Microbacterium sp. SSM24]
MRSGAGEMFAGHRVASSRDVDHARQALSEVFLPVDFSPPRTSRTFEMHLNALTVGQLTCGYMRFGEAVRIETAEAENFHIDIPTGGRAMMRAGLGPPIHGTQDTAGIFMPGRPVAIESDEGFAQLSLMISRARLQLEVENLLGHELSRPLEFSGEIDLLTPGAQTMMQALRMIDQGSRHEGGLLAHPLATQRLEQILMHSLLFAQPHNHSAALASPSPDSGVRPVSHVIELLRSDPAYPWTVAELAAEVSLSVRSLQEGFRRSLNTTPMAYLRRLRLEEVRRELVSAAPGTVTVTEVAARWGFTHLGRFAAVYRSEYSELPSDTMRSATAPLT